MEIRQKYELNGVEIPKRTEFELTVIYGSGPSETYLLKHVGHINDGLDTIKYISINRQDISGPGGSIYGENPDEPQQDFKSARELGILVVGGRIWVDDKNPNHPEKPSLLGILISGAPIKKR